VIYFAIEGANAWMSADAEFAHDTHLTARAGKSSCAKIYAEVSSFIHRAKRDADRSCGRKPTEQRPIMCD